MCQFKSAIVLKNGDVLHNEFIDSHEDIITINGLKDNKTESFVRVEYLPTGELWEIGKYKLSVDEPQTPEWFDKVKDKAERKLKAIINRMIISVDTPMVVGRRIIVKPGVKILSIRQTVIDVLYKDSRVNVMWGNSQVNVMRGNSQVNKMWENSRVNEMWGNSRVNEMRENSQVNVMRENSQVNEMRENSQVNEMWGNSRAPRKPVNN